VSFVGDQLIATFIHVRSGSAHRKTVATYDLATGRMTDVLLTMPEFHGGKGGAAGNLLVAHGVALSLVEPST
jgi:hypothetical protein